jgi:flagellar motor protein MotB
MKREMIDVSDPRVTLIGHPAPAWMVNYADLMTELVCFFIVLYALSASLNKDVQKAKSEVEEAMKQEQVQGQVKVDKDGMKITIEEQGGNVFFNSGSADLSPRMMEIMAKIVPSLQNLAKADHQILVEGHTDNLPIRSSKFPSNWELSTARATSVVQHMIKNQNFPPDRLGALGYGQFQPVAPNDSEANRAKNRRIVFFVKNAPIKFTPEEEAAKKKKEAENKASAAPTEETASAEEETTESPPAEEAAADESNPVPEPNSQIQTTE